MHWFLATESVVAEINLKERNTYCKELAECEKLESIKSYVTFNTINNKHASTGIEKKDIVDQKHILKKRDTNTSLCCYNLNKSIPQDVSVLLKHINQVEINEGVGDVDRELSMNPTQSPGCQKIQPVDISKDLKNEQCGNFSPPRFVFTLKHNHTGKMATKNPSGDRIVFGTRKRNEIKVINWLGLEISECRKQQKQFMLTDKLLNCFKCAGEPFGDSTFFDNNYPVGNDDPYFQKSVRDAQLLCLKQYITKHGGSIDQDPNKNKEENRTTDNEVENTLNSKEVQNEATHKFALLDKIKKPTQIDTNSDDVALAEKPKPLPSTSHEDDPDKKKEVTRTIDEDKQDFTANERNNSSPSSSSKKGIESEINATNEQNFVADVSRTNLIGDSQQNKASDIISKEQKGNGSESSDSNLLAENVLPRFSEVETTIITASQKVDTQLQNVGSEINPVGIDSTSKALPLRMQLLTIGSSLEILKQGLGPEVEINRELSTEEHSSGGELKITGYTTAVVDKKAKEITVASTSNINDSEDIKTQTSVIVPATLSKQESESKNKNRGSSESSTFTSNVNGSNTISKLVTFTPESTSYASQSQIYHLVNNNEEVQSPDTHTQKDNFIVIGTENKDSNDINSNRYSEDEDVGKDNGKDNGKDSGTNNGKDSGTNNGESESEFVCGRDFTLYIPVTVPMNGSTSGPYSRLKLGGLIVSIFMYLIMSAVGGTI